MIELKWKKLANEKQTPSKLKYEIVGIMVVIICTSPFPFEPLKHWHWSIFEEKPCKVQSGWAEPLSAPLLCVQTLFFPFLNWAQSVHNISTVHFCLLPVCQWPLYLQHNIKSQNKLWKRRKNISLEISNLFARVVMDSSDKAFASSIYVWFAFGWPLGATDGWCFILCL